MDQGHDWPGLAVGTMAHNISLWRLRNLAGRQLWRTYHPARVSSRANRSATPSRRQRWQSGAL